MHHLLYTLLIYLLLPFAPIKLLWRGVRQPEYLKHWGERFGVYGSSARAVKPLIWLHCVSVGETRAAEPLVRELQRRHPQYMILITHGTPTGRWTSKQLFADSVERAYLPYDSPGAVKRFLHHYQPKLGLLLETELWFNLIAACKSEKIPLLLVNARLSEKSARGYAKIGKLAKGGLNSLVTIAAQTEKDAQRLQTLKGGDVAVSGNLKFDVKPPLDIFETGKNLRQKLEVGRPIFLAASTRDGEEELILDALAHLNFPDLLTVIVPRHPQRFDEVASLIERRGLKYLRRSVLQQDAVAVTTDVTVVLGDSMGEMFSYYASCDVAFIGGSLLPYGGQNLIEAATMGKPLLIGPHTFNFEEAAEQAVTYGAAVRVAQIGELSEAIDKLMRDVELREKMGSASLQFSRSAIGATARIADMIEPYLST